MMRKVFVIEENNSPAKSFAEHVRVVWETQAS